MLYRLVRPLLHEIDPENAHRVALELARAAGSNPVTRAALRAMYGPRSERPVEAFGLRFRNPIGLAAGYDKDGLAWRGLACLGFGHVEIGTVTPRPQPGNPRPRVFRLSEDRSLINRLGFPSRGADFVASRIGRREERDVVLGVNLGKQKETPLERAADDYVELIARFAPLADYLVVNVSSPNTPDLRELQRSTWLRSLVARLKTAREDACRGTHRPTPLLVKLSPDLTDDELDDAVDALLEAGIDGIVATNTTLARDGLASAASAEAGGLSGSALARRSTAVVRRIAERAGGRMAIVACGGVAGADEARAKLGAGASLVQLYTGLVYEGPGLVGRIVDAL